MKMIKVSISAIKSMNSGFYNKFPLNVLLEEFTSGCV